MAGALCGMAVVVVVVLGGQGRAAWAIGAPHEGPRVVDVSLPVPVTPVTPLGPVSGAVSGIAGAAAQASAATVLDSVSHWVADGTEKLLAALAQEIDQQTQPDLGRAWFDGRYSAVVTVAVLLSLPLIFASALTAIVRQDAMPLVKAVFVHLPMAAIGTFVAMELITLALAATDGLCAMVSSNNKQETVALFSGLSKTLVASLGTMGFAMVLVAIVLAIGAFFLTLEMVVRSAAVYVAVLFLPLALTGLLWPGTARWGRRLAEMLAVLILSKFVVVAIVSMALAAVSSGTGDGLSSLLTGGFLLLIAAAAPFTLLRMVPIIEAGMIGHLEGAGRTAVRPPRVVQQPVEQRVVNRLLEDRGISSSPGPVSDGPVESRAPTSVAERGLGADGTQLAGDRPVPVVAGPGSEAGATATSAPSAGSAVVPGGPAAPVGAAGAAGPAAAASVGPAAGPVGAAVGPAAAAGPVGAAAAVGAAGVRSALEQADALSRRSAPEDDEP